MGIGRTATVSQQEPEQGTDPGAARRKLPGPRTPSGAHENERNLGSWVPLQGSQNGKLEPNTMDLVIHIRPGKIKFTLGGLE